MLRSLKDHTFFRPLHPVICALLSTVHDFCFAKIQNRYTMDAPVKTVWCHNQLFANTTYRWITRGGESARSRQPAIDDGRLGLVSTTYTLSAWWNLVHSTNILQSIEKQQTSFMYTSSLRSTMQQLTTNGNAMFFIPWCWLQPFWLCHMTSSAKNSLPCHEYLSIRKNT